MCLLHACATCLRDEWSCFNYLVPFERLVRPSDRGLACARGTRPRQSVGDVCEGGCYERTCIADIPIAVPGLLIYLYVSKFGSRTDPRIVRRCDWKGCSACVDETGPRGVLCETCKAHSSREKLAMYAARVL
jgi:hypothetical protein